MTKKKGAEKPDKNGGSEPEEPKHKDSEKERPNGEKKDKVK